MSSCLRIIQHDRSNDISSALEKRTQANATAGARYVVVL